MNKTIAAFLIAIMTTGAHAESGCNVAIATLLSTAAQKTVSHSYNQLKLTDPPKVKDISCIQAIFDFSFGGLIKLPNIRKIITGVIDAGCKLVQKEINKIPTGADLQFDPVDLFRNDIDGVLGNGAANFVGDNSDSYGANYRKKLPGVIVLPTSKLQQGAAASQGAKTLEDLF